MKLPQTSTAGSLRKTALPRNTRKPPSPTKPTFDSTADSQQTNAPSQQDSNESNETDPSKATTGSDEAWTLPSDTSGMSPQEKATVKQMALEESTQEETTTSDQSQQTSPQVQPPPAKENTPDSQLSRHSTTVHDLQSQPDKETKAQEQPINEIAIQRGVDWFMKMPENARKYAWSLILPVMANDGYVKTSKPRSDSHQTQPTPTRALIPAKPTVTSTSKQVTMSESATKTVPQIQQDQKSSGTMTKTMTTQKSGGSGKRAVPQITTTSVSQQGKRELPKPVVQQPTTPEKPKMIAKRTGLVQVGNYRIDINMARQLYPTSKLKEIIEWIPADEIIPQINTSDMQPVGQPIKTDSPPEQQPKPKQQPEPSKPRATMPRQSTGLPDFMRRDYSSGDATKNYLDRKSTPKTEDHAEGTQETPASYSKTR